METDTPDYHGQVAVIHHSAYVLESIWASCRDIADYLEDMLDIGDDILFDPNEHDRREYPIAS